MRRRYAEALEVGVTGEVEAEHRACDGQTRTENDVRRAAVHVVERALAVHVFVAPLVIAAEQEDHVVGPGGDDQQREDVRRIRRQANESRVRQERDDPAGRRHLDEHRDERDDHRDERAVDDQQHHRDHPDGQRGDQHGALVAHLELIGDLRRRAGEIGVNAGRRRRFRDDVAHRVDRLQRQRLALVACEEDLNVGGLAVRTLRTRGRQRIAPEVLHMLDVRGVLVEPLDQLVVVRVRVGAERLVTFEHHHRGAVGVELTEHLADPFERLQRRRIGGGQPHVLLFTDRLELRHQYVRQTGDDDPEQHDRHAQPTNPLGDPVGERRAFGGLATRRRGGSSGLVQAVGEGVQRVDSSLVFDVVVDLDPAADGVAVALGGDVDEDGG